MSTTGPSREATVKGVELQLDMIADALRSLPPTTNFIVGGQPYTAADLLKVVDGRRAPYKSARDLRNQLQAITRQKRDGRKELGAFIKDVRDSARSSLGRANPDLKKFGFTPERERAPLTSEENARRAERARATRAARHTMGSRQKAAIHGVVTGAPATAPVSTNGH